MIDSNILLLLIIGVGIWGIVASIKGRADYSHHWKFVATTAMFSIITIAITALFVWLTLL